MSRGHALRLLSLLAVLVCGCPHDLTRAGGDASARVDATLTRDGSAPIDGTKDRPAAPDQPGLVDFKWKTDPLPWPDQNPPDKALAKDLKPPLPDKALVKDLPPAKDLPLPPDLPPPKDLPPPPPDQSMPPDKGFTGCGACVETYSGCVVKCSYPSGNSTLSCTVSGKSYACSVTGASCGKKTYCTSTAYINYSGCKACKAALAKPVCLSPMVNNGGC